MTHPPPHPRATEQDLTAKARIRNTALDMYAQYGADRVSLRAVAAEAGVTLGLVQHHFKTKAGLRDAVDQLVVDHFALAIAEVSAHDDPAELAAARDEAVRRMLIANPVVVSYIRRSVLESSADRMHLLDVLVDLTRSEVVGLREAGLASTRRGSDAGRRRVGAATGRVAAAAAGRCHMGAGRASRRRSNAAVVGDPPGNLSVSDVPPTTLFRRPRRPPAGPVRRMRRSVHPAWPGMAPARRPPR